MYYVHECAWFGDHVHSIKKLTYCIQKCILCIKNKWVYYVDVIPLVIYFIIGSFSTVVVSEH